MLTKHERYYDSGMDALVIVCSRNTNGIMIWANVMRGIRSISGPPNRKTRGVHTQYFGASKPKNAMRGIRSMSGPRNISNVWFVPRRPHPKRSAKYAFFARLRSGGANDNKTVTSPHFDIFRHHPTPSDTHDAPTTRTALKSMWPTSTSVISHIGCY